MWRSARQISRRAVAPTSTLRPEYLSAPYRDPALVTAAAILSDLSQRVRSAREAGEGLKIIGGNTKAAWWSTSASRELSLASYHGILSYEPSELVVIARSGTRLDELETTLATSGQRLAFEPPRLAPNSTIGGVVASGLAGPARAYRGGVRDYVLGVTLLADDGSARRFGGAVMKNVAGYDISRLNVGAWGQLGPLLEVSLRVEPCPPAQLTLSWHCDEQEAWRRMVELGRIALPVTGCRYEAGVLHIRIEGNSAALGAAIRRLQPPVQTEDISTWERWRDFTAPWFQSPGQVWRVVVPPATPPLRCAHSSVWDWGGALRWLRSSSSHAEIAHEVIAAHGYCQPWPAAHGATSGAGVAALTERVRASFDPKQIFNPS